MPEIPKKSMEYFRRCARNYRKIRILEFCSDFVLKIGIFSHRNLRFENRDNFFAVRYQVDKSSCRRFLKSPQNHAIFEFFSVFISKRVTPLFFTGHAGNVCPALVWPSYFTICTYNFLKKSLKKVVQNRKMNDDLSVFWFL